MSERGTGWVVAQFVLMAVILAAGIAPPAWADGTWWPRLAGGVTLIVTGLAFAIWARRALGRAFTPFPKPIATGLVTSGPFAIVRHPVYTGLLAAFCGYALLTSVAAIVVAGVLLVLWLGKIRLEERLLREAYPEYAAYRTQVRWRLLPFIY